MSTLQQQGRRAGLLYLLTCLPAPFALLYVPGALMVTEDAAATADRLRTSETLLRLGIAGELFNAAAFIFAALALYRFLRRVDEGHALAMLILFVASVPISFVNVLNDVAALMLAKGDFLAGLGRGQLDALAYLFLRLHGQGLMVAQIFWGLWLFPFAILVIRSGFIPRVLGYLLIVAGCAYVAASTAVLVLPRYAHAVGNVTSILEVAELPIVIFLLIWGARPRRIDALPAHS